MNIQQGIMTPKEIIDKIKSYNDNQIIINIDREKNFATMKKYNILTRDIINIVKELKINNYKKYIKTADKRYKTKYLYEFNCNLNLENYDGVDEIVDLYIKIGFHEDKKIMFIVSFHEND